MMNQDLENKYNKLKGIIEGYKSAVVAFSGGIDSTLLAFVTHNILAQKSLAVTVKSEFISDSEYTEAITLAQELGFQHKIINLSVLENYEVCSNTPLRCKHCKSNVFKTIICIAEKSGIKNVFDGSNIDDLSDYRPGFEAVKELDVKSPLIEADFSKKDIRELAKILGISIWNKPALACLASRISYGTVITEEILEKVEKAENFLTELGYSGFRVRHHNEIARIELNFEDIEKFISLHGILVDTKLRELGYNYVCLDLAGYKTGSMNKTIQTLN